jgi:hypothetical protein
MHKHFLAKLMYLVFLTYSLIFAHLFFLCAPFEIYLKGQPGVVALACAGSGHFGSSDLCTQTFPAFLQEVVSRT